MLRRPLVLRPICTHISSSSARRAATCSTGVFPSAPAVAWQRRFCSSSSARRVVEFKGSSYVDRRGTKRRWTAVKKNGKLKPVSGWKWDPFCTQFTELAHSPSLDLPRARSMEPAMQVFAKLDIDENVLRVPPKGVDHHEHCNIEQVMKNGFMPDLDDARYIRAPAAERKLMLAEWNSKTGEVKDILKNNRKMVEQLADELRQEEGPPVRSFPCRKPGRLDPCSRQFLQMCGFDHTPFMITAEGPDFRIFNAQSSATVDQHVVTGQIGRLAHMHVFEVKSLSGEARVSEHGHLGQIAGTLLQQLSLNRANKIFCDVFAVRFINYRVTAFRVEADPPLLRTLVETRKLPRKKLQLLCTEEFPVKSRGFSLIDKKERLEALRLMADIRNHIFKQSKK